MRLIVIIFLLLFFSACQKKSTIQPAPAEARPLSVEVLLEGIGQCQKDPQCLQQLNDYFAELSEQARIEETLNTELPEDLETAEQPDLPADQSADLNKPLLDNPRVQAALNEWLTWKRPKLLETWNNYQFLKAKVWPPFASKNIPEPLILAIIALGG